jgi:hypothetical protein
MTRYTVNELARHFNGNPQKDLSAGDYGQRVSRLTRWEGLED